MSRNEEEAVGCACGAGHGHGHDGEEHAACACGHCHEHRHGDGEGGSLKVQLIRVIAAAVLTVVIYFLPVTGVWQLLLFMVPYLIAGYDILLEAAEGIAHGEVFDENFLMAVATVGALALGDYPEAAAVMIFYKTGELFEDYAVGRSRRSITELMDIRPDYANLERDGKTERVSPEEVPAGSVIVVRPGEKIPIDGEVLEGSGALDTAALTGESVPRDVVPGEAVMSGCISLSGVLRIRTTKAFGESTVSKILTLVEDAADKKSRSEAFITRFARIYTPAVCGAALLLALLPPLIRTVFLALPPLWGVWVTRALTFLVISCPCALVISIPLGFFGGLGGASRRGVLIKGSSYLETLAGAGIVVFDKTGTLTRGKFEVTAIRPQPGFDEKTLLEKAALAENFSVHPISESIRAAWGGKADPARVTDVEELSGRGVRARVDGTAVAAGNGKLMAALGLDVQEPEQAGTVVHVAVNGAYAGHILIADVPKPTSAEAVRALRAGGVRKIVMLTGDAEKAAAAVAKELGVDEYHAGLLPQDKVDQVERLLGERAPRERLVFVGDGINDAPVLARADVGVAMGGLGSDAAIEAADVVLMDDDPARLSLAVRISRKCLGIVRQNIGLALGVKGACLLLGAVGLASMWVAIFADVGVMVLAVLNAMRTLSTKNL